MLFVTFHETIPNIYGYDETNPGSSPIQNLIEPNSTISQLSELRGMLLVNGFLYVVNGGKGVSNVVCCAPDPSNKYHFTMQSVFMPNTVAAVNHPFDVTFRPVPAVAPLPETQIWYVANQDTNVVASFSSPPPYELSNPSDTSEYLSALLTALQSAKSKLAKPGFLPATFVPTSEVGAEIPQQTTVDPSWGGLTPSFSTADPADKKKKPKQKVQNSVRGVVFYNGVLYVADEAGNAVRMYDPATGVPWGSTTVPEPVHLLVQNGTLYVTSSNSVLYGPCVSAPANSPALPTPNQFSGAAPPPYPAPPSGYTDSVKLTLSDLGLDLPKHSGPSGLTFDASGNLYVALRKTMQIYKFIPNQPQSPFAPAQGNPIFTLTDSPEFLLWVENQS